MSIGVHSWFGKYDIVELNCILLFLLSWIIVTAFGALCYKNFRFFLFDACSRQPSWEEWKTLKSLVNQRLTDVETKCLDICKPIDNEEVSENSGSFTLDQIFGSAAKSPSFFPSVLKDLEPNEIKKEMSKVFKIKKIGDKKHIIVNRHIWDEGKNRLRTSGSCAASGSALKLFSGSADVKFALDREENWKRGNKSLDDKLREINRHRESNIQWVIEGNMIVPKSVKVASVGNANFGRALRIYRIRKKRVDRKWERKGSFHTKYHVEVLGKAKSDADLIAKLKQEKKRDVDIIDKLLREKKKDANLIAKLLREKKKDANLIARLLRENKKEAARLAKLKREKERRERIERARREQKRKENERKRKLAFERKYLYKSSDGRYRKSKENVIFDTRTNLEWYVSPNKIPNWSGKFSIKGKDGWDRAYIWAQGLSVDGGGWRLPSLKELKGICERGKSRSRDPVFDFKNYWVWTNKTHNAFNAWAFTFSSAKGQVISRTSNDLWTIAVRSVRR